MSDNELLFRAAALAINKLIEKGSCGFITLDGIDYVTINWDEVLLKLEEKLMKD